MTDLVRWFDELTHKYLEVVAIAHLGDADDARQLRQAYRVLLRDGLDEKGLAWFSQLIAAHRTYHEQHPVERRPYLK